jgi:catechol 2,3-dioxygenase-like lactoylglutathione lyase family enzyme
MMGWGAEHTNFALELTYNYGIGEYANGNDYRYIAIRDDGDRFLDAAKKYRECKVQYTTAGTYVIGPDDYKFRLIPAPKETKVEMPVEPFQFVSVNVADLEKSYQYYTDLGMVAVDGGVGNGYSSVKMAFAEVLPRAVGLELVQLPNKGVVNRGEAYGRIAFDVLDVKEMHEKAVASAHGTVINTPITLTTPDKADVVVTILADPDGQEICFVGKAGYDDLCIVPEGGDVINWETRDNKNAIQQQFQSQFSSN